MSPATLPELRNLISLKNLKSFFSLSFCGVLRISIRNDEHSHLTFSFKLFDFQHVLIIVCYFEDYSENITATQHNFQTCAIRN